MNIETLKFGGKVVSVAEDEMKVAFSEDKDAKLQLSLYDEFVAAGKPKQVKAWIRAKLEKLFVCVAERPVWVEEPYWPFEAGKPMVFIQQISVPTNQVSGKLLSSGDELYIFGCREYEGELYRTVYRTISQNKQWAGLVATVGDMDDINEDTITIIKKG